MTGLSPEDIWDLYAFPDVGRPWLRTVFVSTADGSAVDGSGVSGSLGGDVDSRLFQTLRTLADVVLVGAGTARDEGYGPIDGDGPVLALVSRRLAIPESLQVPGTVVVTTRSALEEHTDSLDEAVEVIAHGDDEIDWSAVLTEFAGRGWLRINCEGGPHLHGALLAADVVDDVCLTVDPSLVAGSGKRIAVSGRAVSRPMRLAHAHTADDVLLLRYVRDR